ERDTLFKTVWDDNGMRSSNSNLNQYISILRKQLVQVGLPENIIITVPRVGFMFNPDIDVQREIPVVAAQLPRFTRGLRLFIASELYYPVFTLFVILLCAGLFFIFFYDREPGTITLAPATGYPAQCDVYALPGGGAVKKMAPVPSVAEHCDKESAYFIFKHSGSPDDRLIVSCEKSAPGYFSLCHNLLERKG
ncbi:transcriptional regulator, partial [Salmonella enterica subsp. enterica serovar Newport]